MRDEEVARFEAVANDGTTYTVVEYQSVTTFRPLSGSGGMVAATTSYTILDGSAVDLIDEATFKIVATDEIIRRV
jgi:hypothetical protein